MPEDKPKPVLEEIDWHMPFKDIICRVNSSSGVEISGFPEVFYLRASVRNFN